MKKQISIFDTELIVDNFAGGGGASTGILLATGRSPDIAINHDPDAIRMHKTNHPDTLHFCEDVWAVDPVKVVAGRPVGLCWFSPDCKHFSKAKGGKPVEKKIRGLAWIVLKWAALVKPRVIMLENVEEFQTWGPLNRRHHPIKAKMGQTFHKWRQQLEDLGYKTDYKELIASDYGAPTTRKRFFLIARCDGNPIKWPEPTHGNPKSLKVQSGKLQPWHTASEIIDWSIPCPSIFERKKPLSENTMKRIARGIKKFVIDNPAPFIVQVNHSGENFRGQEMSEPLPTITAKHGYGLVTPSLEPFVINYKFQNEPKKADEPLSTITAVNGHYVVTPSLIQYHGETSKNEVRGQSLENPILTVDGANRYAIVSPTLIQTGYGEAEGQAPRVPGLDKPLGTVVSSTKHALVSTFLSKYYGGNYKGAGSGTDDPLRTITSKDRFGLVTIKGVDYAIVDIGMRMLEPKELYAAQGFPKNYIIDRDYTGKAYPRAKQVARCGNAVPPAFAESLVRANMPELCGFEEVRKVSL